MERTESQWESLREQVLLDPGCIQLNAGSFSPVPKPVFDALGRWRLKLASCPSNFFWREIPPQLDLARARLAKYVHASPSDLVLVQNATFGVNAAVRALDLPAGSEILMTDQEYGAARFCWLDYAKRRGWLVREAPIPMTPNEPGEIVDATKRAIGPKTKVLFFSHVTSPTGLVLPARELCRLAAEKGILSVIDGAHAPGLTAVNLEEIGADFYSGNCHKWLMAPSGAAFLHVPRRHHARMRPVVVSWGWEFEPDRLEESSGWGGSFWQRAIEFQGTIDRSPLLVLPDVLDFREMLGDEAVYRRVDQLVSYLRTKMAEAGLEAVTPENRRMSGTMTAFLIPNLDTVKARDWIWNTHRVECPFTTSAGRCYLRVSSAWFNHPRELNRVAEIAKNIPYADLQ